MDLKPVCDQIIAELGAGYPERELRFQCNGDLRGEWDSDRLSQALTNLVANALQYGGQYGPVQVTANALAEEVVLAVRNKVAAARRRDPRNLRGARGDGLQGVHSAQSVRRFGSR
jgi:signal transduction histidine kinase